MVQVTGNPVLRSLLPEYLPCLQVIIQRLGVMPKVKTDLPHFLEAVCRCQRVFLFHSLVISIFQRQELSIGALSPVFFMLFQLLCGKMYYWQSP